MRTRFPQCTFQRHKEAIKSMFDIDIRCDRQNGNRYYIDNAGRCC
ncbi:hypothetical protein [Alistipes sp.]